MLYWVLLVFAFLQSLHIPPWVSWHSEILVFFAVLALTWQFIVASAKARPAGGVEIPAIVTPIFGLIAIVIAQYLSGAIIFRGDAFTYVSYLIFCATCLTLGFNFRRDFVLVDLAVVMVIAAVCSVVVLLVQALDVWESSELIHRSISPKRSGSNIGQSNQAATLLLMGLASLIYLYEKQKAFSVLCGLLTSLLLLGVAVTESRTAYLSFIGLGMWWFIKASRIQCKLKRHHVLLFAVMFTLFCLAWPVLFTEFYQNALDGASSGSHNSAAYNRFYIWPQLIQAVWLRPWWGWGFGGVSSAHNAVADAYAVSEPYTYAHNLVLDLALGIGIPLTLLFMAVVAVWIKRRVHLIRDVTTWYCIALAIPVAVHSMLEFPFAYAYFLFPLMLVLGLLERSLGSPAIMQLSWKPMAVGLCVATALLIWSTLEYLAIEEDFRVARAEGLRIGQTQVGYERPRIHLFTQLDALSKATRTEPRPNMPVADIELMRTVALRFPWSPVQYRYALSLALNGNLEEAARQLRVMRALHGVRYFQQIRHSWSELARTKYSELAYIQLPN